MLLYKVLSKGKPVVAEYPKRRTKNAGAALPSPPLVPCGGPRYVAFMSQLKLDVSPADRDDVQLRGTLERVVFHNPENAYTVFRLRPEGKDDADLASVVGCMPSPQVGAFVLVRGRWVNNPRFGRQLHMTSFESVLPSSAEGIRLYLSSGLIKGIGKRLAERIVDRFGERTFEIFDNNPAALLEIQGISPKKLETVLACWTEHQGIRELMLFLQPHDISAAYAVRIYRHYGRQALAVVRENPYRLAMDIRGIGFQTADTLAGKLGFAKDHPLRAQAGTLYTLLRLNEEGHVCCPRAALTEQTAVQLDIAPEAADEALGLLKLEERIVIEEADGADWVYLSRFHHYEARTAFYLHRILRSPKAVNLSDPEATIRRVTERLGIAPAPEQLEAVRTAVSRKIMVLTGGPGTGKTTILKAVIEVFAEYKVRILLAAPTGRAAKRLSEACRREARTIHRLLEYNPKEDGFGRNEDHPLACGLLVVDEASMMDAMLAYHLLKAAPLGATVLFVGDVHQLPSVGPGNVLRDLIASGVVPVVELTEVFRQAAESDIVCNAHLINRGELPRSESSRDRLSDFYFMRESDPEKVADLITELVKERLPRRFGFDPVNDIQVLTPMHKGTAGAANLNLRLQQALNPSGPGLQRGERIHRCGDKVMQIRNNYEKDVFNGDIGRITFVDTEAKTLCVRFDDRTVVYDADELDELVPAYAVSIHKSQGSEYPAVVIPLLTQHYVLLQRNLIYTAVTRGKRLVVVVGEPRAMAMAVKNNRMQQRHTRLAARLAEPAERASFREDS